MWDFLMPKITKEDVISLLKGAIIAGLGALLAYLTDGITHLNLGVYQALAVALFGVAVNFIRKYFGIK
jgi:hypothetical protein